PYSAALRRSPPPGTTIACARGACRKSSAGLSLTNALRAQETGGSERANKIKTPDQVSARPKRGLRRSRSRPAIESNSALVGGNNKAVISFFVKKNTCCSPLLKFASTCPPLARVQGMAFASESQAR